MDTWPDQLFELGIRKSFLWKFAFYERNKYSFKISFPNQVYKQLFYFSCCFFLHMFFLFFFFLSLSHLFLFLSLLLLLILFLLIKSQLYKQKKISSVFGAQSTTYFYCFRGGSKFLIWHHQVYGYVYLQYYDSFSYVGHPSVF